MGNYMKTFEENRRESLREVTCRISLLQSELQELKEKEQKLKSSNTVSTVCCSLYGKNIIANELHGSMTMLLNNVWYKKKLPKTLSKKQEKIYREKIRNIFKKFGCKKIIFKFSDPPNYYDHDRDPMELEIIADFPHGKNKIRLWRDYIHSEVIKVDSTNNILQLDFAYYLSNLN